MKRIILTGLLIMCFLLIGCGIKEDKNELVIKVNNNNINYLLTTESFTTKDDFKKAYSEINSKELIYVSKGSKVSLDLNNRNEKVNIKAYWIDKEGFPIYNLPNGEPLDMEVNVEESGNSKYEFTVEGLLQTALSSHYEENEKVTAGYVAELQNGDETRYCYFMIQIDKN